MRRIIASFVLAAAALGMAGCHTCDVCDDCGDCAANQGYHHQEPGCTNCGANAVVRPAPVATRLAPTPVQSVSNSR